MTYGDHADRFLDQREAMGAVSVIVHLIEFLGRFSGHGKIGASFLKKKLPIE